MIFRQLILENFSAYRERQIVDLAPKDSAHPIVLIGGLNGAGKTSLLLAIKLVLFGKRISHIDQTSGPYQALLKNFMHSNNAKKTSIELNFETFSQGDRDRYTIRRSWKLNSSGKAIESFEAFKNGAHDRTVSATWEEFVDAFVPVSIANLFFFDGEAVADIANKDGISSLLKTGIESLLGINLLSRLQNDLADLIIKKSKAIGDSELEDELNEANDLVKGLQRDLKLYRSEFASLSAKLKVLNNQLAEAEGRLKTSGAELFIHRKSIEDVLEATQSQLEAQKAELIDLAAGALPLALVGDLLGGVQKQDWKEQEAIQAKAVLSVLEERDNTTIALLRKLDSTVTEEIEAHFSEDRLKRNKAAQSNIYLRLSEGGRGKLNALPGQLAYEKGVVVSLVDSYQQLDEQATVARRQLSMVPPEELATPIIKERDDLKGAITKIQIDLDTLSRRIEETSKSLNYRSSERDRIMKRLANEKAEGKIEERVINHAELARERVGMFSKAVLASSVAHLEECIFECLSSLFRKGGFVAQLLINQDDFAMTLKDSGGREIPIERLSAGERQLVIISILWGLGRASGRPLPVIIDTPLGRLDSIHRDRISTNYLPNASHQVILLSTDTEFTGDSLGLIKESLSESYTITHDEKRGSSKIYPGYFH